jgi:formate hydrogenlyase subunit 3/multisubunit Na+/H+ antiporter MnhD subunit
MEPYYQEQSFKYNSTLVLIASVAFFMLFKKLHIKSRILNKIITAISPLTLGVYLIQENVFIKKVLWENYLPQFTQGNAFVLLGIMIIDVIGIFVICICIEKIRQMIFEFFKNNKISIKMSNKIKRIDEIFVKNLN